MIKCITDSFFVKAYVEKPYLTRGKTDEQVLDLWRRQTKALRDEIKRHCDSFESLEIEADGHYECTFCSSRVADKSDYECCDASIEEHNEEKPK